MNQSVAKMAHDFFYMVEELRRWQKQWVFLKKNDKGSDFIQPVEDRCKLQERNVDNLYGLLTAESVKSATKIFMDAVFKMRTLQKQYFARDSSVMGQMQEAEREVDAIIARTIDILFQTQRKIEAKAVTLNAEPEVHRCMRCPMSRNTVNGRYCNVIHAMVFPHTNRECTVWNEEIAK